MSCKLVLIVIGGACTFIFQVADLLPICTEYGGIMVVPYSGKIIMRTGFVNFNLHVSGSKISYIRTVMRVWDT